MRSLGALRNVAIIAAVALVITVLPGHGPAISAVVTAILIAFFVTLALFANRLYREHRFTLDSLPEADRFVLYGSIGLAFLDWAAWEGRLHAAGGLGVLAALALLGAASLGVYWVFTRYRSYG